MDVTGTIKNIRYRNDENGWTVLALETDDKRTVTAVGVVPAVNIGERVIVSGSWGEHPLYGEQLKISSYKADRPTSLEAVLAYLSSGFIKGIGKATARLIVDKFGAEALDIIRDSPMELVALSGIGPKKARQIHDSYVEKAEMQDIVIGMQQLGLSLSMTMRIYKRYGADCVQVVKQNPYRLIDDIESIGFKTADKIASEAGVEWDSSFRIRAGIKYALSYAAGEGNTCLPRDTLIVFASNNILNVPAEVVTETLEKMLSTAELTEKVVNGTNMIFLPYMYKLELNSASMLHALCGSASLIPAFDLDEEIERLEKKYKLELASLQREAVKRSISDGVLVITGGPGTGKTTILRFIIEIMEHLELEIELAAPTGRAAKRISDTTDREARTLHRLLEYNASTESFSRNEEYPLEADVIIIDEMSMVDISLMKSLLCAVSEGTRLIMVGDVDQLPSVGAGNVLRDIVESGVAPVIRLNDIFRQAGRSRIVTNAHLVNNGKPPVLAQDEEFMFYYCPNARIALDSVKNLCADFAYLGKSSEVQVLSPMKANLLGVINLNAELQSELNPPNEEKNECKYGETVFREGDRVMQIKNNYDLEWYKEYKGRKLINGTGVFNGDIGTVMRIENDSSFMTVLFDDERTAEYSFTQLEELELAYCISVHKSQGSEFPIVVLPLVSGPMMLFNRNILYTAITRARERVFILGTEECIKSMVANTNVRRRYSVLSCLLCECMEGMGA